jgi:hypothetical protein
MPDCGCSLVCGAAAVLLVRGQYGIRILVSNQSGGILTKVVLREETHGPRYELGDLGVGLRKHIFIQPKTASSIVMDFRDTAGTLQSDVVVGYVERGYCGNTAATVLPSGRVKTNEHINILFCKGSWFDFLR